MRWVNLRSRHVGLPLLVILLLGSGLSSSAEAVDWRDWFTTPEQRAATRFEAGDLESLIDEAPDAQWEGIGRYATGDAEGALEAFSRDLEPDAQGQVPSGPDYETRLYNKAVAETRTGRVDEAIEHFEELLARDPEHEDAKHNLEIARQLKELEQNQSQDGEGGESGENGEPGEPGENGQSEQDGDSESADQGDASSEGGESGDSESSQNDQPGSEQQQDSQDGGESDTDSNEDGSDSSSDDSAESDAESEAAARAAAEAALEAERQQAEARAQSEAGEGEPGEGDAQAGVREAAENTPSELEQATEQWLRRIEDDPSGLLRRRLERSHQDDYPEVRDGVETW